MKQYFSSTIWQEVHVKMKFLRYKTYFFHTTCTWVYLQRSMPEHYLPFHGGFSRWNNTYSSEWVSPTSQSVHLLVSVCQCNLTSSTTPLCWTRFISCFFYLIEAGWRWSHYLNKIPAWSPTTLLKRLWHRCFSANSGILLRTYFVEHLQIAASETGSIKNNNKVRSLSKFWFFFVQKSWFFFGNSEHLDLKNYEV